MSKKRTIEVDSDEYDQIQEERMENRKWELKGELDLRNRVLSSKIIEPSIHEALSNCFFEDGKAVILNDENALWTSDIINLIESAKTKEREEGCEEEEEEEEEEEIVLDIDKDKKSDLKNLDLLWDYYPDLFKTIPCTPKIKLIIQEILHESWHLKQEVDRVIHKLVNTQLKNAIWEHANEYVSKVLSEKNYSTNNGNKNKNKKKHKKKVKK